MQRVKFNQANKNCTINMYMGYLWLSPRKQLQSRTQCTCGFKLLPLNGPTEMNLETVIKFLTSECSTHIR